MFRRMAGLANRESPSNPGAGRRVWSALHGATRTVGARCVRQLIGSRRFQLFGGIVHRIDTTEPVVALTFDDGPHRPHCETVLETLRAHSVRATFFIVGSAAERAPGLLTAMLAGGHELGNHSYSHCRLVLKSMATIKHEIERTDAVIHLAGQEGSIPFRPPYGAKLIGLPWYLAGQRRRSILWDVEPDRHAADSREIVRRSVTQTRPGSIVLLHPMCRSNGLTREALPDIITCLRARGMRFVTISELLALQERSVA
jgi:peptidoglycan/xylan/chitin deacetylase (PgdA/CDA1 family)